MRLLLDVVGFGIGVNKEHFSIFILRGVFCGARWLCFVRRRPASYRTIKEIIRSGRRLYDKEGRHILIAPPRVACKNVAVFFLSAAIKMAILIAKLCLMDFL